MGLTYKEVINNLHQIDFAETENNLLDEYFHVVERPAFVEKHNLFYPQGIFTEEGLSNFYFFTETKIAKVSFGKTIDTQIWKLSKVSSYKLIMRDYYHLKLEIQLETGDVLQFDSEKDSNVHRTGTMKKKIQDIYNLLEEI